MSLRRDIRVDKFSESTFLGPQVQVGPIEPFRDRVFMYISIVSFSEGFLDPVFLDLVGILIARTLSPRPSKYRTPNLFTRRSPFLLTFYSFIFDTFST